MKKENIDNQEPDHTTEEMNHPDEEKSANKNEPIDMKKDKQAEVKDEQTQGQAEQEVNNEEENQQQEKSAEAVSELDQLKGELSESKDKYIRLYSEFENFRRRTAKERIELTATASEGVIQALLPILDDFERTNKALETNTDVEALKEGVSLVFNKFAKTLEKKGLKVMEVAQGSDFDAELHEAITQFPAPDEKLKGKVIDVVEKGYYLGDKVVRFAKVVIGA